MHEEGKGYLAEFGFVFDVAFDGAELAFAVGKLALDSIPKM